MDQHTNRVTTLIPLTQSYPTTFSRNILNIVFGYSSTSSTSVHAASSHLNNNNPLDSLKDIEN